MTPAELAADLGIPAGRLRQWLRGGWPRPAPGRRWELTDRQVNAARAHFGAGAPAAPGGPARPRKSGGGRKDSDEGYVLGLIDEALGEAGLRQHRFDWLRGDENSRGIRARLPVDGYWPGVRLVVEYRERQHHEPVALFDRRSTVSGVGRGEQRRRYDELRDRLIPKHGLTLLVVQPSHLDAGRNGRLRRNRDRDAIAIRTMLERCGLAGA